MTTATHTAQAKPHLNSTERKILDDFWNDVSLKTRGGLPTRRERHIMHQVMVEASPILRRDYDDLDAVTGDQVIGAMQQQRPRF